jgi:spermidine synthase
MSFSFLPKIIYQTKSKISGSIAVKEQFGQLTLHVQGMLQSGGIVKGAWEKVLKKARRTKRVKKALIFGLGGGTAAHLIQKHWPEAKIVGVEIDPEIIKIGEKFFNLNQLENLKIIKTDAFVFLKKTRDKFDLVIVDLYLGDRYPVQAESNQFLIKVKKLLAREGLAIFNRLKTDQKKDFEKKFKKYFPQVDLVKTAANVFYLAQK